MSDERFLIVNLLIKIIPLGLFIGLSIIFLMRWMKSSRNRVRERQVQTPAHSPEHNESAANEPETQSRFYIIALLDALLFLYLLFSYEWSPGPGLSSSVGESPGALIGIPIYYALVSARFGLQVLFFTCLGASIYMSRFYVGRWPQWFKLSCLSSFAIGLAWLLYQWGLTAWRLPQSFPSDLPRGLHDLLITGLFSDCGIRLRGADAAVSIRQSTGMYLLEWLAAIYLVEKYLRLAVFHERRDERGPAWWARFTPLLPVLLIAGLVGLGLWGDFQRERMITHVARMEISVLQPQATLQWHTAVEQCADQGAGWRLPTEHELYVLSSGDLGKDSRLGAAWSGELHAKGGPQGLRWTGRRHQRPTYVPDVMHRCLSAQPTDLYQRLVVSFYPDLYQQHRNDSFYRYFYPHEGFSVYGGLEGGEPEAVLCVKPNPTDPPGSVDLHLAKDVTLVTDVKTAASLLESLCNDTGYDPNYCHRSLVHRYTEVDRLGGEETQDSLAVEQRFQKRLEECRLTADANTCTGHGEIYLARGEYDRLRPFYEEACRKYGVEYGACNHGIELDERAAAFGKAIDEVMSAGLVANRPARHHEAKEPLMRACELGRAQSCGYLGYIFELQNRHSDAWQRYDKGCSLDYLWACTKLVFLNRKNITTEQTKQQLVDLCYKGESLACDTIATWKWSEKEPDVQSALEFATRACSLGSQSGCATEVVIRKLGNSPRIDELDPNSVQPSTPYDIKLFRSACIQNDIHCQDYVERLTLQGQFKEAEWFNEQACIEQHSSNLKECSARIPWRGLFESMSQVLVDKKYIKERPADHASMVPALKKACQDGIGHACDYLGSLMYDAMTGHFSGSHPIYTRAGLMKPFQQACQLDNISACTRVIDLAREFHEGKYGAERDNYPRASTTEEIQAYARLCERQNNTAACAAALEPWLTDSNHDVTKLPSEVARIWHLLEIRCEQGQDAGACWIVLKPWLDYLEHDQSKLPKDRSPIRRQLERLCTIETEKQQSYKRACHELNRYIDLHWL